MYQHFWLPKRLGVLHHRTILTPGLGRSESGVNELA